MTWLWLAVTGAAMGLLSGLLGIGGGVVAVPLLMFAVGMSTRQAMGTSLAIIVPVAIAGAYKQYTQKNVDLTAALCIAASGMVFAWLGAYLNGIVSPDWLKRLFGVFLLILGAKMVFFPPKEPKATVSAETAPTLSDDPSQGNSPAN